MRNKLAGARAENRKWGERLVSASTWIAKYSKVIAVIAFLETTYTAYLFLVPTVAIVPSPPSTDDPLSSYFTVQNTWRFSIDEVKFECDIGALVEPEHRNVVANLMTKTLADDASKLTPGESTSITCAKLLQLRNPVGLVALVATFKPYPTLMPWYQRSVKVGFELVRTRDGKSGWIYKALSSIPALT